MKEPTIREKIKTALLGRNATLKQLKNMLPKVKPNSLETELSLMKKANLLEAWEDPKTGRRRYAIAAYSPTPITTDKISPVTVPKEPASASATIRFEGGHIVVSAPTGKISFSSADEAIIIANNIKALAEVATKGITVQLRTS